MAALEEETILLGFIFSYHNKLIDWINNLECKKKEIKKCLAYVLRLKNLFFSWLFNCYNNKLTETKRNW